MPTKLSSYLTELGFKQITNITEANTYNKNTAGEFLVIKENNKVYRYENNSILEVDNSNILNTSDGGNTRWIAISGNSGGEASIPDQSGNAGKFLSTNGSVLSWEEVTSQNQIQADWNQTDDTQVDFIKNKPTKLSQFTNDTNFVNTTQLATKQDNLTTTQLNAVNSGITSTKVSTYDGYAAQITSKQNTITGGASTITSANLTASHALVSDSSGKVAVSDVTSTELGYLDGVKSNIQAQIDGIDVTTDIKAYISTVYPVGSLYFSTASTCPLQTLGIGTWNKVGTSLTLSVNTSVPVKGNGELLTFENKGSYNDKQLNLIAVTAGSGFYYTGITNASVNVVSEASYGLTTDSAKSGIVGTITRTQLTVNVFQRTA